MSDALHFTENAAKKVFDLIKEEGNFKLKLRVYVTGGGCSGFQYGFTFDEIIQTDDQIVERKIKIKTDQIEGDEEGDEGEGGFASVQLLVDSLSFQYLTGAEIDYKEDIEGEQFIIRNPNAKTTCGCGSSFAVE